MPPKASLLKALIIPALLGLTVNALGYFNATAVPIVRQTTVSLPGWPTNHKPVRALLISDLHVAIPGSSPERLDRIVDQINAQNPDIILLAGDFVSTKQIAWERPAFAAAVAPLKRLRAPLGVFAVLGNHDHWMNAEEGRSELKHLGIHVLDNQAAQVGPISLGGVDDAFTWNSNVAGTTADMRKHRGAMVLLSHSPDIMPETPSDVSLVLAGHTHCGQVALPIVGPLVTMSRYGKRYACGIIHENGKTLVVGSGTGTSLMPIRFGAPSDMWLITLNGA